MNADHTYIDAPRARALGRLYLYNRRIDTRNVHGALIGGTHRFIGEEEHRYVFESYTTNGLLPLERLERAVIHDVAIKDELDVYDVCRVVAPEHQRRDRVVESRSFDVGDAAAIERRSSVVHALSLRDAHLEYARNDVLADPFRHVERI